MSSVKPECRYGIRCYRRNPQHFEEFNHPAEILAKLNSHNISCSHSLEGDSSNLSSTVNNSNFKKLKTNNEIDDTMNKSDNSSKFTSSNSPYGIFLTKVHGIDPQYNAINYEHGLPTIGIKDILNDTSDEIIETAQFNYIFEIEWLVDQYPTQAKECPLYIVFGTKNQNDYIELKESCKNYKQIVLCPIKLSDMYGTHHTKMMLLHYKNGLRIVIHTANLVHQDWHQKTQGIWISPMLPLLKSNKDECKTNFKNDLLQYLHCYNSKHISKWCETIQKYDFSMVKVFLVSSVPGRHKDANRNSFGHLKFRKILSGQFGPMFNSSNSSVICQFSSIGSLGSDSNKWLTSQFLSSLAKTSGDEVSLNKPDLKCIFPTVENVRNSLEGYMAGSSLPYSYKTAARQPYLQNYFHQWKASSSGRDKASPHIKTYCRITDNFDEILWFCLTSANLSKAAWGELQCNGSQLAIRSFELGVVFLPKLLCNKNTFQIKSSDHKKENFHLPYDIPLTPYGPKDKPWMWDLMYVEKPDSNGNIWAPE